MSAHNEVMNLIVTSKSPEEQAHNIRRVIRLAAVHYGIRSDWCDYIPTCINGHVGAAKAIGGPSVRIPVNTLRGICRDHHRRWMAVRDEAKTRP